MPFITITGLNKSYSVVGNRLHVLRDLELSVEKGEMVAIMGASGVGKSTLLHVLGGLDTIDSGEVRVGAHDIAGMGDEARVAFRNRHIGFVFQFHHLLPEFTAVENAAMPLRIARVAAAERDVSVSRFVGDLLREKMAEEEAYELALQRNLARKARRLKAKGQRYPSREELHD